MTILYPAPRPVNRPFALGLLDQTAPRVPLGPSMTELEAAKGPCPADAPTEAEYHAFRNSRSLSLAQYAARLAPTARDFYTAAFASEGR